MAPPIKDFFISLKDWIQERYWRMCFLPSTLLAVLLTLFFKLTLPLPMDAYNTIRVFFLTAIFTYSIGSITLAIWGVWSMLPIRLTRIQRHLLGLGALITGVFLGTTVAVIFVADMVGRSFWDMMNQILVFNIFITVVVVGLMVVYEQMRVRLETTLEKLKEKEVSEQRLLRLKTQAELSSLQARINPHFLFNSLNSIASLVTIDPKRAETAVEMLSKLLRFSLRSSERRKVQLVEEFEIVKTYLDLEKIRLGERLKYDIKVEGDVSMVCIPGMLLQPLVENCIKHGFSRKVSGGMIQVSATVDTGRCRIVVEDNGVGWTQKGRDGGIGLANIRERLNLYFGGRCTLELYNREGAVVDISFPVEGSCTVH